ncbi:hypothetical protein [Paenibacillus thermotolerans]|uniref:hypothetical protein n=1 Tax=Paenibacillus thermotolerans TaxID=3027807 RepID=UPI0023681AF6|nr:MULTISPECIES: hypothetical protein [unclassified Paenibacillus]
MSKTAVLSVDPQKLADAWNEQLPFVLSPSDKATVTPDEKDSDVLHIHVTTAGRTQYTLDFKCTYKDTREVHVEFVDVDNAGIPANEQRQVIQTLIEDYIRHIHECAQRLKGLTNP